MLLSERYYKTERLIDVRGTLDRTNADAYLRKLDDALRLANEYAKQSQDFLTVSNYE